MKLSREANMPKPSKKQKREFRWWTKSPKKLTKLREAFLMGATDKEACIFAQITPRQLYYYQEQTPDFVSEKELLKTNPILKARKTIYENLNNPKIAMRFLESKLRDEFDKAYTPPPKEREPINYSEEAQKRLSKYV